MYAAAGFLAGLSVALTINSFAQPYLGINVGAGTSANPAPDDMGREYAPGTYASSDNPSFQLGLGVRSGKYAAEIGWIKLPTYKAHAIGLNPTREADQVIQARALYARGFIYLPKFHGTEPFTFLGVAYVSGQNHEWGWCDGCPEGYVSDWHSDTKNSRPYYGLGFQQKLRSTTTIRAEIGRIPGAVDSLWTGKRDYTVATLGVQFSL